MSKPSVPEWASGGSALITEPTSGKKGVGWAAAERPPGQYLNWWQHLVYLWLLFLDGIFGANGSITLPSGENLTFQGAGDIKHAAYTQDMPLNADVQSINLDSSAGFNAVVGAAGAWTWVSQPLSCCGLRPGDRINQVTVHWGAKSTGTETIRMKYIDASGGVVSDTEIGKVTSTTTGVHSTDLNSGSSPTPLVPPTLDASGKRYYIVVEGPGASAFDKVTRVTVQYDRP